jgi:hypothetical protein
MTAVVPNRRIIRQSETTLTAGSRQCVKNASSSLEAFAGIGAGATYLGLGGIIGSTGLRLSPVPQKLVPQKHIGSAAGCTARGAERSADDRTHGTGASRPFRASALHPRDRAGYRVSVAR